MSARDLTRLVKEFSSPIETIIYENQTIAEAIAYLRNKQIEEKILYFYVIDHEEKLKGVVTTRSLLLKPYEQKIKDVMCSSIIALNQEQTLEEAMRILAKHHLLALPIVDKERRLKGMIDVRLYLEESTEIADAAHTQDVFQLLGLTLDEERYRGRWKSYKIRMPWIFCNMIGGIACAIISYYFQAVLAKVLLLAMFIPLILTLSESISMQSMTQSLQLVRKPRMSFRKICQHVFVEARMVTFISATCALIVGALSLLWGGGIAPSGTIAVSIFFSISLSASVGACVPLALYSKALDPKVASGPVVLMFADVLTTLLYLSLATWWLL